MFGKGLSLKDNPNVIPFGKFVSLDNCVFDTLGQLGKRNGFGKLTNTLGSVSYLTTFENNLIGLGSSIQAYSGSLNQFINKGSFPQVQVTVTPISNYLFGQTYADVAISNNGLMCEVNGQPAPITFSGGNLWTWTILDQSTGQLVNGPNTIVSSGGIEVWPPKVFSVGSQFAIVFDAQLPLSVNSSAFLEYVTVPTAGPFVASSVSVVTTMVATGSGQGYDGLVASNSSLLLAWNGRCAFVDVKANTVSSISQLLGASVPNIMSICKDSTLSPPNYWSAVGQNSTGKIFYTSLDSNLNKINSTPSSGVSGSGTIYINSTSFVFTLRNITMNSQNGSMTAYVELSNSYSYDDTIKTNLIYTQNSSVGVTASLTSASYLTRGMGLASKAFVYNSSSYVMGIWKSPYQSTYFLINSTGQVQAKVGYGNANQAYLTQGLPTVSVVGTSSFVPGLFAQTIQPVGNQTNAGSQSTGIYSNAGTNLMQFNFASTTPITKEIGKNLILGGGFLGNYDGQQFTESGFFLFPDSVNAVAFEASGVSGAMSAQTYFYQAIYEWVDNKGNIFRSAPSIPVSVLCTTSTGAATIRIPTLRTSYKNWPYGGLPNPSQIKLFRWSQAQPIYYLTLTVLPSVSSNSFSLVNFQNIDSTLQIDARSDSQIIGGEVLYTNGGVVDDVNGPATKAMTTFDSRLWLIDAEDQNLLWFSKQVIENTPVEMSDLFTFYVAPNVGAEGPTGVMNCLAPMDDKLVIMKESALYYINGRGPDNTGAQNQYSDPIFITSGIGCSNQNSIVLIPNGLMFQSNKGIWLLGRDLSTQYIGKDVESIANTSVVLSAITIPGTNQVRFTMNTGKTLLYDYFVNEWGTFSGQSGISSCLYNNLHTYVSGSSSVYQETPGLYLDGTNPTLMSFTTGWLNLGGLQGYVRSYRAYLLGTYYSPHNFSLSVAYDYNQAITQVLNVNPTNTTGSGSTVEQWQLNFQNQQCQSFQLTFNEISSQSAGQGLTISGLDLVYGGKKQLPGNVPLGNRKG